MLCEMVECQILAIDLRGHGDTITLNDEDLSIETLSRYSNNELIEFVL